MDYRLLLRKFRLFIFTSNSRRTNSLTTYVLSSNLQHLSDTRSLFQDTISNTCNGGRSKLRVDNCIDVRHGSKQIISNKFIHSSGGRNFELNNFSNFHMNNRSVNPKTFLINTYALQTGASKLFATRPQITYFGGGINRNFLTAGHQARRNHLLNDYRYLNSTGNRSITTIYYFETSGNSTN